MATSRKDRNGKEFDRNDGRTNIKIRRAKRRFVVFV